MAVQLAPAPVFQGLGFGGLPLPGGQLFTYQAGTSTPQATYTDSTGLVQNSNPTILNANGQANVWMIQGLSYKLILKDAFGNQIWSVDNIFGGLPLTTALIISVINSTVNQAFIGAALYPQTPAEISIGITPTTFAYPEGDIRRYGATTAATDNSTSINSALSVSSAGGNAAFIPGGKWKITSTLLANAIGISGNTCMYGVGYASTIVATGCDGLSFTNGQGANDGARFFRDFSITGSSAVLSANNGITVNVATGSIVGIQFSNLVIENFQKAVFVNGPNGLRNCEFVDCWLQNNYHGYYIFGQAIILNIRGGFISAAAPAGTMTGTGPRYGFFSQDNTGNLQSLHLIGVGIFNYDYLINLINTVYIAIENCDLSDFNICGVFVGGRGGTFVIRDCWIQATQVPAIINYAAIFVQDLGTQLFDRIIIDGNSIYGSNGVGGCGVYLGNSNTGPVSVTNNTIGSASAPFVIGVGGQTAGALGISAVGIGGIFSNGSVVSNNNIYASTTAILVSSSSSNITVRDNITQNGTAIAFSNSSVTPANFSYSAPGMKGTASFSSSTAIAVSVSMPSAGYFISLGGNAAGFTWPTSKTTSGFTINCNVSNSNPTDWSISYN